MLMAGDNRASVTGLPVRWVLIAILTSAAAAVGFVFGGPVPAITAGASVAVAAHKLIA
jgi:hypothetical protein